jgi:endonuclease G
MKKARFFSGITLPVIIVLAALMVFRYGHLMAKHKHAKAKRTEVATGAGKDNNIALGNPSNATANENNRDNYLLTKAQFVLSYNNSKGMANWVSWHLSAAWMGSADRCNCFKADETLPADFTAIKSSNYIGTGFDRGHLCPSADRSATEEDNAATFLMTNMSPQSPVLNEQTWEHLESYCRALALQGNELYIIAGAHGTGGIGKKGYADTIANGRINVPSHFWKIIVVLPLGDNDISRVTNTTRVIAVDMPNRHDVNAYDWGHYRCTVDQLEAETGYDFLSAVPVNVQKAIESLRDSGPVN